MKKAVFAIVMLISSCSVWEPAWASTEPYAETLCKLALENIRFISVGSSERWMEKITTSFEEDNPPLYIDHSNPLQPKLNDEYETLKDNLLIEFYLASTSKSQPTIIDYIISMTIPENHQGVLSYLSKIASEAADSYDKAFTKELAFLNSVNASLQTLGQFQKDITSVVLAELEVLHPKEYQDLKDAAETHSLYRFLEKIRTLDFQIELAQSQSRNKDVFTKQLAELKTKRVMVVSDFKFRRKQLYDRLSSKGEAELTAAIALFGEDI